MLNANPIRGDFCKVSNLLIVSHFPLSIGLC